MITLHPRFAGLPGRCSKDVGLVRPFSVLIDGMDLTGKTTLARLLVEQLQAAGLRVVHHRGYLAACRPLRCLERMKAGNRPNSSTLNAAFLASGVLDRILPGVLDRGPLDVVVQESYIDRVVGYGVAAGPWAAPLWASRYPAVFPSFDLAVLTRAAHAVRRRRFEERDDKNPVDAASVADTAFETRFYGALELVARRHRAVERVDTVAEAAEAIAQRLAALVLERVPVPVDRAPLGEAA